MIERYRARLLEQDEFIKTHYSNFNPPEYPLDDTTVRWKRILGIRNNFKDGIKRTWDVDTTRNQKIIDISKQLIADWLFKIHQVTYEWESIPVFSLWDNSKQEWVSRTTTQHIISLDQAKKRNTDPNNTNKSKLIIYDFKNRTPKNVTQYDVVTMDYTDIKNRSTKGISSLPYGDHLQNMAEWVGTEWVQIEVEHAPGWYMQSTVLPLLQSLSGYNDTIQLWVSHDMFGVMQCLIGWAGVFYYNNTNSFVNLQVRLRWLDHLWDYSCTDFECALFAKVTWPKTRPKGEEVLAQESKTKPQEFVDFEKAWLDKVRDFPTEANFGEMILGGMTIPAFSKTLNDFAWWWKDRNQIKKDYETAVKNEIKQRMDLWAKQYVSYTPNYKDTKSNGIIIRNSSINAKLNWWNPIVLYALNNKDYIDDKVKHLWGVNSSSAITYMDYITWEEKVEFYRRNFTDKNNKTLDSTQPSTWLDADMHWANDVTHHNLLKPIIQDISQDGLFQWFPDRDDRASMIAQDCGIPYANDKDKKFGFMALQYFINQWYWFWSKQTAWSNTSPYVYLGDDTRWLDRSDFDDCALCAVDYLDRQ